MVASHAGHLPSAHSFGHQPGRHLAWNAEQTLRVSGMPQERLAQIAAQAVYADMKQRFAMSIATVHGARGEWLRRQVRDSESLAELWLLRGPVFSALREQDSSDCRHARFELYAALAQVFPDHEELLPVP